MPNGGYLLPPRARDVYIREIGDEIVAVNSTTQQAHALSGLVAHVFRASATGTWIGPVDDEFHAALEILFSTGLLLEPVGVTRRSMLARTGLVAAGVGLVSIGLPAIDAAASGQTISLSPASGPKGTTVTISGSGFPANSLISVTFNGNTIATSPAAVTTDGSGNIPAGVTIVIPSTATTGAGNPNVVSVVAGAQSASANFIVPTPTVTLSQTTFTKNASPGTFTVTASSGFFPSTSFTDSAGGNFSSLTPASGTTTASGTIPTGVTYTVTYASGATKAGTITFTDSKGNTATVNVTTSA